ncbi:MAG: response regulator [bacterium]|nr:response regulator [bacterium]
MHSVPPSARSLREAQIIQLRPRILFWDAQPNLFSEVKFIFEEMNWVAGQAASVEECVQSFLSSAPHVLYTRVNELAEFQKLIEGLKYTGKWGGVSVVCINGGRDLFDFLKEKETHSMFFNSTNHNLSHVIRAIRTGRPDLVRIAIADDLFVIRSQLKMAILIMKYSLVAEASNGVEATNACMDIKPDVLTLDINMPMKNGLQTLSDVRQASPHTRIIMISGQGTETNVIESARQGIKHFVSKPFTRELLISTIRQASDDVDYLNSIRI